MKPNRRTFLALLGLAPAAPLLAKVALEPEPAPIPGIPASDLAAPFSIPNFINKRALAEAPSWSSLQHDTHWLERDPMDHRLDTLGYHQAWRRT